MTSIIDIWVLSGFAIILFGVSIASHIDFTRLEEKDKKDVQHLHRGVFAFIGFHQSKAVFREIRKYPDENQSTDVVRLLLKPDTVVLNESRNEEVSRVTKELIDMDFQKVKHWWFEELRKINIKEGSVMMVMDEARSIFVYKKTEPNTKYGHPGHGEIYLYTYFEEGEVAHAIDLNEVYHKELKPHPRSGQVEEVELENKLSSFLQVLYTF